MKAILILLLTINTFAIDVPTAESDLTVIIDYISGFISGFTGGNKLEELESCYSGG